VLFLAQGTYNYFFTPQLFLLAIKGLREESPLNLRFFRLIHIASMTNCLTPKTQIRTNPSILDSEIDDEVVLLNIDLGKYFGLDPVASEIWKRIQEPISIETLIKQLLITYTVEKERCEKDTMEVLDRMLESGLIQSLEA